jgi:hypothetical protein
MVCAALIGMSVLCLGIYVGLYLHDNDFKHWENLEKTDTDD